MNKVNRILRLGQKPKRAKASASELRRHFDSKWGEVDGRYTKAVGKSSHVPVIFTAWGFNVWRAHVEMQSADVIRVDGVTYVRHAALQTAAARQLPEWKERNKVERGEKVKTEPFTEGRHRHIQIKYSEARKKA